MILEASSGLYAQFPFQGDITYSGKFKPYNANVRLLKNSFGEGKLFFGLSEEWEPVSREIQIGLIQELMLKILRRRLKPTHEKTKEIELYHIFMRKIHLAAPKDHVDPALLESFNRVNQKYFNELIELTNLRWGDESYRNLGRYEYGSDTITVSRALAHDAELLDYVIYHEMLHKKHKYHVAGQKSMHHTKAFKADEAKFENYAEVERRLGRLPSTRKKMRWIF
ncbi:M48 family metallopeptidase [Candidatus Woesearchaeota archaeon]|nr:M48 family metallopeptidase [Candidatus Woesearchaeota archaeon]